MKEAWKLIANGFYAVSNFGRVKRMKPGIHTRVGKIVGTGLAAGYPVVGINGKTFYVHDLVAENFIGPKPFGMEVNHKDTIKTNNRWDNLEYKTHSGNQKHAIAMGCFHPPILKGEENGNAKLSDIEVAQIRYAAILRIEKNGVRIMNAKKLGKRYGVPRGRIWAIVNHRQWK